MRSGSFKSDNPTSGRFSLPETGEVSRGDAAIPTLGAGVTAGTTPEEPALGGEDGVSARQSAITASTNSPAAAASTEIKGWNGFMVTQLR